MSACWGGVYYLETVIDGYKAAHGTEFDADTLDNMIGDVARRSQGEAVKAITLTANMVVIVGQSLRLWRLKASRPNKWR